MIAQFYQVEETKHSILKIAFGIFVSANLSQNDSEFFLSHSLCLYSHNSDEHIFNIAWFLDGMTTQSDTLWYREFIYIFLHFMLLLDAIYLHWFKLKEKKTTDLQFSTSGSWFYYSIFHDFKNRLLWKYPSTQDITRTTRISWIIRTTSDREKTKRFSIWFQAIFLFYFNYKFNFNSFRKNIFVFH